MILDIYCLVDADVLSQMEAVSVHNSHLVPVVQAMVETPRGYLLSALKKLVANIS